MKYNIQIDAVADLDISSENLLELERTITKILNHKFNAENSEIKLNVTGLHMQNIKSDNDKFTDIVIKVCKASCLNYYLFNDIKTNPDTLLKKVCSPEAPSKQIQTIRKLIIHSFLNSRHCTPPELKQMRSIIGKITGDNMRYLTKTTTTEQKLKYQPLINTNIDLINKL